MGGCEWVGVMVWVRVWVCVWVWVWVGGAGAGREMRVRVWGARARALVFVLVGAGVLARVRVLFAVVPQAMLACVRVCARVRVRVASLHRYPCNLEYQCSCIERLSAIQPPTRFSWSCGL